MCPDLPTISAYYDGELGTRAAREVEEHLDHCTECSELLEFCESLSGRLASEHPVVSESDVLHSKRHIAVRSLVSGARALRMRELVVPAPVAAVAAAVIIMLSIGLLVTFNRTPDSLVADSAEPTGFQQIFELLDHQAQASPIVFELPATANLRLVSEPTLIRAAEYRRNAE